jgi:hypothetical protein
MNASHELKALEVPQVSVDFLEEDPLRDLLGREKLTVLEYLLLDDAIKELGIQKFRKSVVDNIPLEPVRAWVTENWESDFVYDLSKKAVPISFRNSLALALFTTKISDHLSQMGTIEIYNSRDMQKIFEEHKLPVPKGLAKIDYNSLPTEIRRELVIPVVNNLYMAENVARAKLLFPEGVDRDAVLLNDPSLLFELLYPGDSKTIRFDSIGNLEAQSAAARACIKDYVKIRTLGHAVKELEKKEELHEQEKPVEVIEPKPRLKFKKGTKLWDVFPYAAGEAKEDVVKAFRKIADYGTVYVADPGSYEDNYAHLILDPEGNLKCEIGFDGILDEPFSRECNALTGRFKNSYQDQDRIKAVTRLINELKDELDQNRAAIQWAKAKHGKTNFVVEKGFLEVLTGRGFEEVKPGELEKGEVLAKEAKETVGVFEKSKPTTGSEWWDASVEERRLVVYSSGPVDKRVIELDYAILSSIKDTVHFDLSSIFKFMAEDYREDHLKSWFGASYSLLSNFRGVMTDMTKMFKDLGIPPTDDEHEIKNAWREIVGQTHPDRTSNLPPGEVLKATNRYMQATEAYENIMARRNRYGADVLSPTFYLGRISELFNKL